MLARSLLMLRLASASTASLFAGAGHTAAVVALVHSPLFLGDDVRNRRGVRRMVIYGRPRYPEPSASLY